MNDSTLKLCSELKSMASNKTLAILFASLLIPIMGGVLLLDVNAQRSVPIDEAAILWVVENNGITIEFPIDYKITDANGVIALSGTFSMQALFGSTTGSSGSYQNIQVASFTQPFTMEISPNDPLNTWTVIGGWCSFGNQGIVQVDGRFTIPDLNTGSGGTRNNCIWNLDNDSIPPLEDTLQTNLQQIEQDMYDLEGEVLALKAEIDTLQQQIVTLTRDKITLQSNISNLQFELASKNTEVETLLGQLQTDIQLYIDALN